MKASREYVDVRLAQIRKSRAYRVPYRRVLDRGHVIAARRRFRARKPRVVTMPWSGSSA